jgi:hypothetical protein
MESDFLNGLAQRAHLARDVTVQAVHDGALAFDYLAHSPELAGKGVTPSLLAQQLAFFGVSLFELDALGLGRFNGAGQQFFNAFFAQELAELDQ